MSKHVILTEDWIKEKLKISNENLEDIKTLIIQGNYEEKIIHLGNSLLHFSRLKILDLSRNSLKSLKGLDHLISLEVLNLYYNCIEDLNELRWLEHNVNLKDLDLRLNPVSRLNSDYRLYLTYLLPKLKTLGNVVLGIHAYQMIKLLLLLQLQDCRSIRDAERKAAIAYFNLDNQVGDFRSGSPAYRTAQTRNFKEQASNSNSHAYKRSPNHSKLNQETMNPVTYDGTHSEENIKGRLQMEEPDPYDINAKVDDPWTNYFLRANTKPNGNVKSSEPTRGIKQAEFYGKKERLQTEIDLSSMDHRENGMKSRGQDEKNQYTNGKGIREAVQTTNRMQNETSKGPRIPPRGKRYTPSSSTTLAVSTGNINDKHLNTEQNLSVVQSTNRLQSHSSPQKLTSDSTRLMKAHEFDSNMDNSFLLVLKNFIEEAVSESFARYKSNETNDTPLNKHPGQSNLMTSPSRPTEQGPATISRNELANGDSNRKRDYSHPKQQTVRESYTSPDIHREYQNLDNNDGKNRKDLLNENLKLADEVERLRSRLKIYEELAISNPSSATAAAEATTTTLTTINARAAIQLYDDQARRKIHESQTILQTTPLKRTMSLMSSTPNISQLPNSKRPDYLEFEQALLLPSTMHQAMKFHNSTDSYSSSLTRPKFIV